MIRPEEMPDDNTPARFCCSSQTRCNPLLLHPSKQHSPGDKHEHGEIDRHEHAEGVCVVYVHLWSAVVRRRRDQRLQSQARRMRNQHLVVLLLSSLWFVDRTLLYELLLMSVHQIALNTIEATIPSFHKQGSTCLESIRRKTTAAPRSDPTNRPFVACCRSSSILPQVIATNQHKILPQEDSNQSLFISVFRLRNARRHSLPHSPAVSRPSYASLPWWSFCPS